MTLPVWADVVVNDNLGATGAEVNASKWRATPCQRRVSLGDVSERFVSYRYRRRATRPI